MTTRLCSNCRQEKPISKFSRARNRKGGYQGYCKQCASDYQKSERGRIGTSRYYMSGHGKRKIAQRKRMYPERYKAVAAVYRAKLSGILTEPTLLLCADCGHHAREYHHESYEQNRWLDVIPLCCKCHKSRHVRNLSDSRMEKVGEF